MGNDVFDYDAEGKYITKEVKAEIEASARAKRAAVTGAMSRADRRAMRFDERKRNKTLPIICRSWCGIELCYCEHVLEDELKMREG